MFDWIKKIAGYAPDIAAAIASGGATLPATAMRIVSKELLGYETDDPNLVEKAVKDATPEQLLALTRCNNEFKVEMARLDNEAVRDQLQDTQQAREVHKHHWMPSAICVVLTLGMIAFTAALFVITVPEANQRVLDTLFGAYLTAWLSSINYWVSSTRSSAEKSRGVSK
jgi:hypothetical protein